MDNETETQLNLVLEVSRIRAVFTDFTLHQLDQSVVVELAEQ